MSEYNIISSSNESTVVTEYTPFSHIQLIVKCIFLNLCEIKYNEAVAKLFEFCNSLIGV